MKNLIRPVLLSLSGYLLCVASFFTAMALRIPDDSMVYTWWVLGIGMHLSASFLVFKKDLHWLAKIVYLLVPVPLGFFMTFFATLLTLGLLGQFI